MTNSNEPTVRIYLAGPLFSLNERASNRRLAAALKTALPGCEVILPQDFKYHGSFNDKRFFREVYRACIAASKPHKLVLQS